MTRYLKFLLAGLIGLAVWTGATAAETGSAKQKVVYHINGDDPKQQVGALRNIQNHINAVGKDNLDLRVVMHGNGLSLVLLPDALKHTKGFKNANADAQQQAAIDNLKIQGVQFKVCANTVKGRMVNASEDLYDFSEADIVPSGVAELAILQSQGFAYIKP
ncbi:MAG: DsrE family protein [Chromatiaceae bacterium]|nr:DsrE family protein [Gammaproteobacteria bacterium]MCP5300772.1 DsrE family protein [Chromatiaceae bacterium]MCP5422844.1 DsrE family protein [Chromatiaceae bacterium]